MAPGVSRFALTALPRRTRDGQEASRFPPNRTPLLGGGEAHAPSRATRRAGPRAESGYAPKRAERWARLTAAIAGPGGGPGLSDVGDVAEGQPFTAPPVMPRTKYRCREKKTTTGRSIVRNAAAMRYCHSPPSEFDRFATVTVSGRFGAFAAPM